MGLPDLCNEYRWTIHGANIAASAYSICHRRHIFITLNSHCDLADQIGLKIAQLQVVFYS